ncbi:MAG: hypothetical protein AAF623_17215 [Planctomycetota bacterium]
MKRYFGIDFGPVTSKIANDSPSNPGLTWILYHDTEQRILTVICDVFEVACLAEPLDDATLGLQLGLRPIGEHRIDASRLLQT